MKRLLMLLILVAGIAALVRFLQQQKLHWAALSDEEIRQKLNGKLDGRVSPEQVEMIADKIISKIRGAGYFIPAESDVEVDLTDETAAEVEETEESGETASDEATANA